jgi:regulator of replication initiation timing
MMKRIGSTTVLLAILAVPAQARSQDGLPGPDGLDETRNQERARSYSAEAILNFRDQLNLTDDQVASVKQVLEVDREVRDAQRLEVRGLRDQLRDGEITQNEFRENMKARRSNGEGSRAKNREALESILSEEQRTQMQGLRRQARGVRGDGSRDSGAQRRPRNMKRAR